MSAPAHLFAECRDFRSAIEAGRGHFALSIPGGTLKLGVTMNK